MEKVNGVYVANTAIVGGGMKGVEETRTETYHVDLDDRFATLAALLTQLKGSGTEIHIKIVI